jgi:hypothetical protein
MIGLQSQLVSPGCVTGTEARHQPGLMPCFPLVGKVTWKIESWVPICFIEESLLIQLFSVYNSKSICLSWKRFRVPRRSKQTGGANCPKTVGSYFRPRSVPVEPIRPGNNPRGGLGEPISLILIPSIPFSHNPCAIMHRSV